MLWRSDTKKCFGTTRLRKIDWKDGIYTKMWLKKNKSLILPIAMLLGIVGFQWLHTLVSIVPITVSIMFFLAYCALDFRRLRLTKVNFIMLLTHVILVFVFYFIASWLFSPIVAKGVLLCIIAPAAASSSSIVIILGGNKEVSIVHIILDNMLISLLAPLVLSYVESQNDFSYFVSVLEIMKKVFPLLIVPFIAAVLLKRLRPKTALKVAKYNWTSLIFWSISLIVIFANTTYTIVNAGKENTMDIVSMFVASFVMCIFQFAIGRAIGTKLGNPISVTQGLSQKNTGLGVWMAHTYISNPLSVIFSAAYSLWQNLLNSWQVYMKEKKNRVQS